MARDPDCIFCRIVTGEIPAEFAYRDDEAIAIADANPQAPQHLLVIPTKHVPNIAALQASEEGAAVAKLFAIAADLGRKHAAAGFRLVVNTGPDGGQTVDHVHVHVLAGREMRWPPG
ncbi:MAG: histidine triad nucleotide-binding protein [Candidatus Meridianibacter frigidus]|nr:MAG: histidine triad nucleotide-binding protein [Candidatus Eremiobacteraeota bacterium]